eukprot:GHVT01022196.1.p5 GENE.GHVT01022196.1~~GHVT01022196.1.p5  ORF type:complete len:102 (-),score=8.47 GHVT01022196.1:2462-2767(-)
MDAIQDFLLVPAAFFVMAFATHQFFVWRGLTKSFLLPLRRHWVVELHQVLRGDALQRKANSQTRVWVTERNWSFCRVELVSQRAPGGEASSSSHRTNISRL